jgi:lysyl-tRNA synthetase class 2
MLAYRVVAGVALVSGEPIGEEAAAGPLLDEFLAAARARALTVAALGVGVDGLAAWRARGFAAHYTGDEAILRPRAFSLEGRRMRKVRQSVTRLEHAGYRVEVRRAVEIDPALAAELAAIAARWRGAARETGYSMAFDGADVVPERDDVYAIAFDAGGSARGFLHLGRAAGALSLSSMRRDRDTPNGLNEFLVARLLRAAADDGIERVSLNFAAFAAVLAAPGPLDRVTALERRALRALAGRFQLDRLRTYNEKFLPEWLPRYVVYPSSRALPRVLVAAMLAEAYIALPRLRRRGRP